MIRNLKEKQLFYSDPDGMRWRIADTLPTTWYDGSDKDPAWLEELVYIVERKPRKVLVLPRAVLPEPMEEKPVHGATYYYVKRYPTYIETGWHVWVDDDLDNKLLRAGECYTTEAETQAVLDAMTARVWEEQE
jgi:hypothetical protein